MNPWWLGLSPAEEVVHCGDQEHRLRWEAGDLRALDHDDRDAERTLAALGGQRCTCVDIVDAWEHHREDPHVLVLASRGPTDRLASQELAMPHRAAVRAPFIGNRPVPRAPGARRAMGAFTIAHGGWTAYGPTSPGLSPDREDEQLIVLLTLGATLQDRLVATVAAAWRDKLTEQWAPGDTRARIHAALYGRVLSTLDWWLRDSQDELRLTLIDETESPTLERTDGQLDARLPFGWLIDVWSKGLATVWGRFALSAHTDDGLRWKLLTVAPDLSSQELITLEFPG
jgi:hypothetical protein